MKSGVVYFVAYDNDAWRSALPVVKIGSTFDLKNRLSQLNTGSPVPLIVAGYIESLHPRKIEFSLHAVLNWCRLNGEWFRLDIQALNELKNYDIKESRIDELFAISNIDLTMSTLASTRDKLFEMSKEIEEKDRIIESMSNRLIEVDPMAYKFIPKKSIKYKR